MSAPAAVEIDRVEAGYGPAAGAEGRQPRDPAGRVRRHSRLLRLRQDHSGCGKTTLLRSIARFADITPDDLSSKGKPFPITPSFTDILDSDERKVTN